jgi:serine/threonine protein kinase
LAPLSALPCRLLAEQYGWNLAAWRKALERRGDKAYSEGFAVLDADGGAGWELLCSLIQYDPSKRLSAAQTLRHPWFGVGLPMKALSSTVASLGKAAGSVLESVDDDWLQRRVTRNGTRESGGFTEAYLSEEGLTADSRKRGDVSGAGAPLLLCSAWHVHACAAPSFCCLRDLVGW